MVPYVLEPVIGIGDRREVWLEIGSGNVAGGFGRQRDELGRCDGGGRGPPADPRGGFGGIGVIKDGGEALAATTCGGGIGIRIGSAWSLSWRPS